MRRFLTQMLKDYDVPYVLKTSTPVGTDVGYSVPTLWLNQTDNKIYFLSDITAGVATWQVVGEGGMSALVDDTTPQLGGDLDGNGFGISVTTGEFSDEIKIANDKWLKSTNYAGTDFIYMFKVNVDDEIDVGATLVLGASLNGPADGGQITRTDMPVSASAVGEQSFTDKMDGNNVLTYGGTPDGSGGTIGHFVKNNGAMKSHRIAVGAEDYAPSILTSDYIIAMTDTAAARNCILSTEDVASGTVDNPRHFIIVDESGNAGTHNITITLENGGTISGSASSVISANGDSISLYCTGTNAFIY